jgi:hypothetical protein
MSKKKGSQQKSRKKQKRNQTRIQKGGQTRKRSRGQMADTYSMYNRRSMPLSTHRDTDNKSSPIEYVPSTDMISIMFPENKMLQNKIMNFSIDD